MTVFARIGGGIIALSLMAPEEVTSRLHWLYLFDADISIWFAFEFVVRTSVGKDWKEYALSVNGVINALAAIPPTSIPFLEALRHVSRFLMTTTGAPFRTGVHSVARATRKIVAKHKLDLWNLFVALMGCMLLGGIAMSALEPDLPESIMLWVLTTIAPFVDVPVSFTPITLAGRILELLLILSGYVMLTWLGTLVLKAWKTAIGESHWGPK